MSLTLRWQDISGMNRLGNAMGQLSGHQKHLALQRALNHTGDKGKTQVTRSLAAQTGLAYGVIKRAIKVRKAWGASGSSYLEGNGSLSYTMTTSGGDVSLKYFKARETTAGVTAAPFGTRKVFAGSFIKGGNFPERVQIRSLNGQVYKRAGKTRKPLEKLKSGVVIPAEMLKGATREVFLKTVETDLPNRVMHEIDRLAPGIFS